MDSETAGQRVETLGTQPDGGKPDLTIIFKKKRKKETTTRTQKHNSSIFKPRLSNTLNIRTTGIDNTGLT